MTGIHKSTDSVQKKTGGEMKAPKLPEPAIELRIRPGAEEIPSKVLQPYRVAMKEDDKKAVDAVMRIPAAHVDILADISVYSLSEPACLAAAKKIPSHEVDTLAYVRNAGAFASVRKAVAERMAPKVGVKSPEELVEAVWKAKTDAIEATNAAEGLKALKRIPDDHAMLFLEIAQNANHVAVARAAVERINDTKALMKVHESRQDDVGQFAMRKYERICEHRDSRSPSSI